MGMMKFNPHKSAIDELMKHLDKSDDEELGMAMKPKADDAGIEVTKVGVSGDPDAMSEMGEMAEDDGKPKLSEEDIAELIEALQAKLG